MAKQRLKADRNSVFLNFPFDQSYEPVFLGIVTGLITLHLKPRSVIEIPEHGEGRMERLFTLIQTCGASIHDLSCVTPPVRFNMPFELGIAFSLRRLRPKDHFYVVMEKKRHRLDKTLSDLKMVDPKIHEGDGVKALHCIYESFHIAGREAPLEAGRFIYQRLIAKRKAFRNGRETIFNLLSFRNIIAETMALSKVRPRP